jgi:hypothetical protein
VSEHERGARLTGLVQVDASAPAGGVDIERRGDATDPNDGSKTPPA